jgi:hypothetical protein
MRLASLQELQDSYNNTDEDFMPEQSPPKKKRVREKIAAKQTGKKASSKKGNEKTYTVAKILDTWNDVSEYGKSFRGMTSAEQELEVVRMNKGMEKGLKTVIKSKVLDVNFKLLIATKMKDYLNESRTPLDRIFHVTPKSVNVVFSNPNFISVGEWVEVDADRTPGFNSEGGIAVITQVHDALVDVK